MNLNSKILNRIAEEHGDSFYLIDPVAFQKNYKDLLNSFQRYYPKTNIAYSYKTNYIPRFCELIEQLGGYAEVVSSMEMQLALKLGVPASKIFFNGPYKEHAQVERLLIAGGTVNVDSFEELQRIAASNTQYVEEPFKLGLRCNFEVDDGVLSRFGFDVDSESFREAIALIDDHPRLCLVGLHCHFATRSLDCWKNRTQGMINVVDRFFRNRLEGLRHISLGGGMYGYMPDGLKAQFPVTIPDFEDYACAAAQCFGTYLKEQDILHQPTLIIEPGTALVADAMKYVCKVNSIKQVRGRTVVSLTGSSYNINPNPNRKNVPIECFSGPLSTDQQTLENAYFGGYTCIEGDYLYKGFSGDLAVGDFVVFDDVGSYSIVMKPPFILPNVAILEPLDREGSFAVIKRGESFTDIFSTYTF